MAKIFGIGLNKTGTKTLGECFRLLGYKNKTFDYRLLVEYSKRNLEEIFKESDIYETFEDWPWPLLFKELDQRYPDAKFILTERRDPQTWFESLCHHADRTGPTEARKIAYGYAMPHKHKDEHIQVYCRHCNDVTNYFNARDKKLLRVCWEDGDGWEQLSSFLNIPLIQSPIPHMNKRL